jgi:hypothetical protein
MTADRVGFQTILAALALAFGPAFLSDAAQAQTRKTPWSEPQGYSTPGFRVTRDGEVRHHLHHKVQNPSDPDCFCWADGRKIAEGVSACIRTSDGRRLAACGRVSNMMSWHLTQNPCPES